MEKGRSEDIETSCEVPNTDNPAGTCGNDAVTWVESDRGVRFYVCEEHATEVERYTEEPEEQDPHPTATICVSCYLPTPADKVGGFGFCPDCRPDNIEE